MRTRDTPISGNLHVIYFKQQNDSERYIIKCYSFIDNPTLAMIISIDCVKTCFPNLFLAKIMGSFPFRHGIPVVTNKFQYQSLIWGDRGIPKWKPPTFPHNGVASWAMGSPSCRAKQRLFNKSSAAWRSWSSEMWKRAGWWAMLMCVFVFCRGKSI